MREQVGLSDFSVVIRDKSVMTDFGFSSKIVESIALGTRVITTRTSDIEKYLNLGQAIYLESYSDEAFEELLEAIVESYDTTDWINPFEPVNFLNDLNKFLLLHPLQKFVRYIYLLMLVVLLVLTFPPSSSLT